jgi:hypothetical protein
MTDVRQVLAKLDQEWNGVTEGQALDQADRQIAALGAAGFAVVPRRLNKMHEIVICGQQEYVTLTTEQAELVASSIAYAMDNQNWAHAEDRLLGEVSWVLRGLQLRRDTKAILAAAKPERGDAPA